MGVNATKKSRGAARSSPSSSGASGFSSSSTASSSLSGLLGVAAVLGVGAFVLRSLRLHKASDKGDQHNVKKKNASSNSSGKTQKKKEKKKKKKKNGKETTTATSATAAPATTTVTDKAGGQKAPKSAGASDGGGGMMAARVAGGRRVVKRHPARKKGNGIASKVQSDTKKKLKEKMNKKTGGLSKPQTSSILPSMQKPTANGKNTDKKKSDESGEPKGEETYSMGYTYTTTVTDARVQAISGK